jgi:phosphoglycolate phosphatase
VPDRLLHPSLTATAVLILDFDGVIIESNEIKTQVFREIFARFPEHTAAMMAYHESNVAVSRFRKFEHLVHERLGQPDGHRLIGELAEEFSLQTVERLRECPLVPGALEFLERFAGRLPIYLASVTPCTDLQQIVAARGLRRFFQGLYGCPPWTKSGAVADVLRITGVRAEHALLIGDSPGDLRAAIETGVPFMGRDSGISFPEPQPSLYPDLFALADVVASRIG